jgi:hypothetical protein
MSNLTTTTTTLTPASHERFMDYINDAGNWSGCPLVGGNVGGDAADKGYIMHWKMHGLATTERDGNCVWLNFTAQGVAYARAFGADCWWRG